ncbi:MAG: tetraacyldisaccharide 4'-kinase [Planctomycetaceae bacterium]|nr:tetraacyldisaccharide 4'-kinase [Planctomycetaceae bacterium]
MSPERTLRILSGEDRSLLARGLRPLLTMASWGYTAATDYRNWRYDRGRNRIHRVDVPIISVGNLTAGGTGKTPTVAWLANWLRGAGESPGILSRGYHALDGADSERSENDEKRVLDLHCPGIPHVQNKERFDGAVSLIAEHDVSVIVLDDGFQHRRLHRDFDLVLIDALNPFGFGHLLPRGLLRERKANLRRADAILITRCESSSDSQVEAIQDELSRWTDAPVYRTAFTPTRLINREGQTQPLELAATRSVCAFCGIGNPQGFRRTLAGLGAPVTDKKFRSFPDHYHYTEADLKQISEMGIASHAELFLTTQKDLVKMPRSELSGRPIYAVEIALTFRDDTGPLFEQFNSALKTRHRPEDNG